MRTDLFDFDLPESLIALRPARPRDVARLMVVRENGEREKWLVCDLPDLLRAGDVLVVNDTKVMPVRLFGRRVARKETEPGAEIEVTLVARLAPDRWRAFARPAKRLKKGDRVALGENLRATVEGRTAGEVELVFDLAGGALDAAIAGQGAMPLPPYIAGKREPDARDTEDYQTMFARREGSIAAPTAGLHFTPSLLARLEQAGVERHAVTLHVGPGTFLPVTTEDTAKHRLHAERAVLDVGTASALNRARAEGRRIVAVGTTALRTLESAVAEDGLFEPFNGETELFITPGYRFKAVDVLMTNFHLPRSTLFMLVCAFAGIDAMKAAYTEAIVQGFRFYSYGDACLLFRSAT